jgi:threonine/homoserine/homoserine lactone efflux protein
MHFNELLVYVTLVVGFALTPGPNMMLYLAYTFEYGRKAGWATAAGIVSSFVVHLTAVIFGLTAILFSSPYAFEILRYLGIIYLIYLALANLKALTWKTGDVVFNNTRHGYFFIKGLICNLFNPGAFFLYFSVLPQFIHPENGVFWIQAVRLAGLQMVFSFLTNCFIVYFAGFATDTFFKNAGYQKWIRIIMSIFILVFAVKLLFFKITQ